METDCKDQPPPYEVADGGLSEYVLEPATLVLINQSVVSEIDPSIPLYKLSWDVTSIPQKDSSVVFERGEDDTQSKAGSENSTKHGNQQLFYLAHPAGSEYQTETPAYYLTCVSPKALGNISLKTSKSRFSKAEFRALLSPGKSWTDNTLFDKNAQLLFDVKPKWIGGRYAWTDANGAELAYEDGEGDQNKLVITAPMKMGIRDALAAMWCLRLWHDTAESGRAKRDAMERLTPPEAVQRGGNTTTQKRIWALGSLAGAGA
ncbi:hypothetical protein AAE478_005295 [Parahypoxylon ruwenzoriense]